MYKIKQNISKWDIFPLWLAIFSRNAAFLWCLMIIYLHLSTLDVIVSSLGQAWESGHRGFFLCHFIIIIFNSIMVQTPFKYFSTLLFNFQRTNFQNNSWALLIFWNHFVETTKRRFVLSDLQLFILFILKQKMPNYKN